MEHEPLTYTLQLIHGFVTTRNLMYRNSRYLINILLLVVVVSGVVEKLGSQADFHSPVIEYLPGFGGRLPFQLTTGYVGVDETEDVQLFYYFVKSQGNPDVDPLILWITGGPGCSSFTALAYEIGPLYYKQVEYDGTLPTLILNPHTWTKAASIIFLELPVGVGFSYSKTSIASHSNDTQACAQALHFLKKWFISHPQFLSNSFYVAGDSYSGIFVPIITQMISNENKAEAGPELPINLKGYLLGNPKTFPPEGNYGFSFAHGMGIISDETYESLRRNCILGDQMSDSDNAECSKATEAYDLCRSGLFAPQILEKNCAEPLRRSLFNVQTAVVDKFEEHKNLKVAFSPIKCRNEGYALSSYWSNDESVQEALHIRKGTIGTWQRCNDELSYDMVITDTRPYHANLSRKGYRSLVYSGDHDIVVPFQSTQAWIRGLNYPIIDDWRPWIVEGQYAGYTRTYSNKMTFATVKGGGHTAPEYKPAECYAMLKRWLSNRPL
ncbi:serine carboxypeptidase-like 17 [Daucus carota subsp. sativus]|nr:PREDICTED: serine carboxypeptidase-like 17 isoform X1 [Daucus carota subsp. sativus]XP_017241419.1 PREDICTED: serine carboxypeptidase-like 17 isoform X1 [Daucus carota subsp. sativus]